MIVLAFGLVIRQEIGVNFWIGVQIGGLVRVLVRVLVYIIICGWLGTVSFTTRKRMSSLR